MTSATLIFFLICLEKLAQTTKIQISSSVNVKTTFLSVQPGQSLTLSCLYSDDLYDKIFWFKQTLGAKPKQISSCYKSNDHCTLFNEFQNNPRFQLQTNKNGANLKITDLESSDSATYYCAKQYINVFDFTETYNVIVEGSGLTSNQSPSESIQSGGSVTLNCTVQAGNCDGDHTVYWFRNSGQSQLGLMYSHGGRKEQCERKTNTCFYSLTLKNQSISHSGSYYCAVAACGRILFGDGPKLESEDDGNHLVLVNFLNAALILIIVVVVLLSISVLVLRKRNSHHSLESEERPSPLSRLKDCLDTDGSVLWEKMKRENAWTECVYYSVKK
uniref:Immune-type receptor 26 n=1 Tax=Sphoeroides nephelus TaxID=39110 RepID=Q9IAY6_9TELE|nr:immune-type receptor 26 [Sphoeroides nephelus]